MKKKSWYFYCILFGLLHTAGAVPPPEFEIMSDEVPRELSVIPSNFSAGFFINSRPDAEEKSPAGCLDGSGRNVPQGIEAVMKILSA